MDASTASVYTDFNGLAELKGKAREDSGAARKEVARQFEANAPIGAGNHSMLHGRLPFQSVDFGSAFLKSIHEPSLYSSFPAGTER